MVQVAVCLFVAYALWRAWGWTEDKEQQRKCRQLKLMCIAEEARQHPIMRGKYE